MFCHEGVLFVACPTSRFGFPPLCPGRSVVRNHLSGPWPARGGGSDPLQLRGLALQGAGVISLQEVWV